MFGYVKKSALDAANTSLSIVSSRVSAAEALNRRYAKSQEAFLEEIESLREAAYGADRTAAMYKRLYEGATKTLGEIAALETPGCANVGKRMARLARRELPLLHHDAGTGCITAASLQAVA